MRREKNREASRARMKALHADPEFREKNRARMKALNADPEFRETNREASRARMKVTNPLSHLDDEVRADYDLLKRNKYSRDDALRAIGRSDLIGGRE